MNKFGIACVLVCALACIADASGFFGGGFGSGFQQGARAGSSTGAALKKQSVDQSRGDLAARESSGARNKAAAQKKSENFFNQANSVKLAAHNDVAKDKKIALSFGLHDKQAKSSGVKFAQGNKKSSGARAFSNKAAAAENFDNAALQANKATAKDNKFASFFEDKDFFNGQRQFGGNFGGFNNFGF